MRKALRIAFAGMLVAGLTASTTVPLLGQVSLTPFVGYQFGGGIGDVSIEDGLSWGGVLGYDAGQQGVFQLFFDWSSTDVSVDNTIAGPADVWSLQAGGLYEFGGSQTFQPFFNGGLGIDVLNAGTLDVPVVGTIEPGTETRFGFHFGLGSNVARRLVLGTRLWLTLLNAGGGFWCGPAGCAVTTGGDVLARFEVYGGFTVGGQR